MDSHAEVLPSLDEGHAVAALRSCPHTAVSVSQTDVELDSRGPICATCPASDEVWICACCGTIGCSRFQAGHAAVHARESGHHIAISWADMSVWCYMCESYLDSFVIPDLHHVFRQVYVRRFHEEPALPVIRMGEAGGAGGPAAAPCEPARSADAAPAASAGEGATAATTESPAQSSTAGSGPSLMHKGPA